ncbi:hypothetical protein [Qiania dongpingensis]|uniref:Uncharacterized protein n=1 Tax=Qiania dongpingensis TaxID=2763669 RepID=A0A7G9G7H3_9FIRM|nr:hypothetical protein [Qiania dongpingensis]QNM06755.1 hypothetical protein H9Q78_06470 [Qiania dongpingensis]
MKGENKEKVKYEVELFYSDKWDLKELLEEITDQAALPLSESDAASAE